MLRDVACGATSVHAPYARVEVIRSYGQARQGALAAHASKVEAYAGGGTNSVSHRVKKPKGPLGGGPFTTWARVKTGLSLLSVS